MNLEFGAAIGVTIVIVPGSPLVKAAAGAAAVFGSSIFRGRSTVSGAGATSNSSISWGGGRLIPQ